MRSGYFEIGKILSPRGLAGELRVYPLTDEPSRFALLDEVFIELPADPPEEARLDRETAVAGRGTVRPDRKTAQPDRETAQSGRKASRTARPDRETAQPGLAYPVEAARAHGGLVFLKLGGVGDAAAAEKLRGASVWIPPEKALPLDEDEYYVRDLIGLNVVTDGGEALGVLTDVLRTGANDVYVVGGKLMIPAVKECVLDVDMERRRVTVALTEGLRDL